MKKIMPNVAAVFFALFGAGIIALLMSYTWQALGWLFPDNLLAQGVGMILFDIASLAWLLAFIYLCKSVMQYAFAFIGFVLGLAGTLGMAALEVLLGGQSLMTPPAWANEALVYGFIGAAVGHVVLFYAYKLAAPEVSAEISLGIETAKITDEGMRQAEATLLAQRGALGAMIAPRLVSNVQRNLGLPVGEQVLDLSAYDVNDLTQAVPVELPKAEKTPSVLERLSTAGKALASIFTFKRTAPRQPVRPAPKNNSAPTPAPAPVPAPVQTADQPEANTPEDAVQVPHPLSEPGGAPKE